MFDQFRLKDVLAQYKQNFVSTQWGNEKYKWEAVKWFQDNWDVNAADFAEMLNRSLDKTFNLLASNNFPAEGHMIVRFAKSAPEEVRAMFIALFDETTMCLREWMPSKCSRPFSLEKYGTEQRSIVSTRMPSAHTYGSATRISITSINSVEVKTVCK